MKDVPAATRIKLRDHLALDETLWERTYRAELAALDPPDDPPSRPADSPSALVDPDAEPPWWDPPDVVAARQRAFLEAAGPAPEPPYEA